MPWFQKLVFQPVSMVIILFLYGILCTKVFFSLGWDLTSILISICTRAKGWYICLGRKKNVAVNAALYRVSQTFFMITAITYITYSLAFHFEQIESAYPFVKFFLIVSCYLSVWSILYFVQLLPSVGHCKHCPEDALNSSEFHCGLLHTNISFPV